jgi:hypothetical protein
MSENPLAGAIASAGEASTTHGKRGVKAIDSWSPEDGARAPPPGLLYSPFTAADEKIPLSIGQVNNKPQHLVFSSHLQHPFAKPGQLACGKRGSPDSARFSELFCPKIGAIAVFCQGGFLST